MKMKYKIELFDNGKWEVVRSFFDLDSANHWYFCYKDAHKELILRLICVLDI